MAKKSQSMDGFIPRRPNRKVGGTISGEEKPKEFAEIEEDKHFKKKDAEKSSVSTAISGMGDITKSEIDESLHGIDDEEQKAPKRRKHPVIKFLKKKWVKRALLFLVAILVGVGIFVGIRAFIAGSNIFQGNVFEIFQTVPLKQDANGRSNILIVGTSEDDPGHEGASLTDSMMILSVNQTTKDAFMISIPRDLYVQYGRACNSGYEGKINEYYGCVHEGTGVEHDRKALAKEATFVGKIFGLQVDYGVNVNYTVMRELVSAVGGSITVTIESRHPDGQMDSNFDWKCGTTYAQRLKRCPPRGHFIDYPNGPVKLDAEHALYLAQARGDRAPTYGFEQSNFDREKNQQKIIKALREKAVSAGVLGDFNKVRAIIDALGKNLRSTFEFKEFRTLVALAQEIKSEDIESISLIDGDSPIMTTGNIRGISSVFPSAGLFNYDDLRLLLKQKMSSNPVVREAAPIVVLNGSGAAGVATKESDKLKAAEFTIAYVGDAPAGTYAPYTLYQVGKGNDGTLAKLKKRYDVKVTKGDPPIAVDATVKFVLIVGPQPVKATSSN